MRTFWALPLRRQLFVAILLLLVPVVVAAVWSGLTTFNERKEELAEQAQIIAATTAAYIDRDIGEFDRMAIRIANDAAVRSLDAEASLALFNRAVVDRPVVLRIALASADGMLVTALDRTPSPLPNGAWPGDVLTSGQRRVGPMQVNRADNSRYIVIGHPVRN